MNFKMAAFNISNVNHATALSSIQKCGYTVVSAVIERTHGLRKNRLFLNNINNYLGLVGGGGAVRWEKLLAINNFPKAESP